MEKVLETTPALVADILFGAYRSSGTDIIWGAPGAGNLIIKALGGAVKFRQEGPPDVVEPLLKKPGDIEKIDITRLWDDRIMQTLREITRGIVQRASGEYPVGGSLWGPLTLATLMYGAENLMRDMRKHKDAVLQILDFTTTLYLTYTESYIENGLDIVSMGEPTASGDMISREHFAEFVVPALKKIYATLHRKKVIGMLHICGNISDRLDLVSSVGARIISLDYKVNLKDARRAFDGKVAFAGNMNPVDVIMGETPERVAAVCRQCLADAGEGGGFILMPGCDIPPSTPLENIQAMTQVVRGVDTFQP
jgi:uroporphyrinogen decarboxylase